MLQWVSNSWADVVEQHSGIDEQHRRVGTNCKRVDKKGIGEYLSKPGSKLVYELSKDYQRADTKELPGRWWGIFNRAEYKKHISILDCRCSNQADVVEAVKEYWREIYELRYELTKEEIEELVSDFQMFLPLWIDEQETIDSVLYDIANNLTPLEYHYAKTCSKE